ncbi:hypothetical protein [Parapedobacter luteus]|uniref:hypothetical protein n=1 Tax=Parapedobacter luteus TaxID=623280 RepID=UPI0009A82269|nr:hypothetical protein [Parapedobacter luteus]
MAHSNGAYRNPLATDAGLAVWLGRTSVIGGIGYRYLLSTFIDYTGIEILTWRLCLFRQPSGISG